MNEKENQLVIHVEADGENVAVKVNGGGDAIDLLNAYVFVTGAILECIEKSKGEKLTEQQVFELVTYCISQALLERENGKESQKK